MLGLSIIFYIVGVVLFLHGYTLNVNSAMQQQVQYIIYLMAFLSIISGSIFLGIKKICSTLENLSYLKNKNSNNSITEGSSKKCPYCAEIINKEAKVCRYCGKNLPEEQKEESKIIEQTEIKDGYEIIIKNGKHFAVVKGGNPDNYFCPYCYTQINPNSNSCYHCNKSF